MKKIITSDPDHDEIVVLMCYNIYSTVRSSVKYAELKRLEQARDHENKFSQR